MKTTIHVWPETPQEQAELIEYAAVIERVDGSRQRLWFRLPASERTSVSDSSDAFVLALLFLAMAEAQQLELHGLVSRSLLRNLTEFQAAWACWLPRRYRPVELRADQEYEPQRPAATSTLLAFSGGVDSAFSLYRHRSGLAGRLGREIGAALMVHGFDIPLSARDSFERAALRAQPMLEDFQLPLIRMATNLRELPMNWDHCFGAAAAACMQILAGRFAVGLLGSSEPYHSLVLPWGSNPITDQLLSSAAMQIEHDGAAFSRTAKIEVLAQWPAALSTLRVCWEGAEHDRNCGRCEKCIRTILNFRALGLALPACFDTDISDQQISALRGLKRAQIAELEQILQVAQARQIQARWVHILAQCIADNKQALNPAPDFWSRLRRYLGQGRRVEPDTADRLARKAAQ